MLTAEQLQERKAGVGGSDVGPILGLNQYTSPLDVYNEKLDLVPDRDLSDNEAVHFGNVLEDVIAQEYSRRTGYKVRRRNQRIVDPNRPWMAANIDRSVDGRRMVLECKNSSQWMSGQWGESGTDEVPESYLVQVAWYMAVLRYDSADLAALIGGNSLRVYHFARDLELEAMIVDYVSRFWHDHVLAGVAPPPTCERDLQTLYAMDDGSGLVATPEIEERVADLKSMKAEIKRMEKEADAMKFDIRVAMGSSSVLLGSSGPLITNKAPNPSRRLDGKRLKSERPDVWEQYAKDVQNSRRFLIK